MVHIPILVIPDQLVLYFFEMLHYRIHVHKSLYMEQMFLSKCSFVITESIIISYVFLSGVPDFTSGFHRGSCCPVICVSLFHVIVLYCGF